MSFSLSTFPSGADVNPELDSFCLQQMIELDLHEHVEAVSTIVDKAMKESTIDKNLNKVRRFLWCFVVLFSPLAPFRLCAETRQRACAQIKEVWEHMVFEYEEHEDLKVPLMKVSDEVMEAVEENA